MTGHRYWQISIPAVQSGTQIVLSKIGLMTAFGGANQIMGPGAGTCTSGSASAMPYAPFYGAGYWRSASLPDYLAWYFGAQGPTSVHQFVITPQQYLQSWVPGTFTLDYSDDGTTWTTAQSYSGQTYSVATKFVTNVATAHLYWRINTTATPGADPFVIIGAIDLQNSSNVTVLQGSVSTSSQGTGPYGSGGSAAANNAASYRLPTFTGTSLWGWWVSAASVTSATWTYDFGAGLTPQICGVAITNTCNSTQFGSVGEAPSSFTLNYSDDNVTWFTLDTFTASTWTTSDQTQQFWAYPVLTGITGSSATGTVATPGSVRITGISATGAVGIPTPNSSTKFVFLTGISATASVGMMASRFIMTDFQCTQIITPSTNNILSLRYSDTGGASWSNAIEQTMGNVGEYETNVSFRRLGMARNRIVELSWDSASPSALTGVFVEFSIAET